jgi:hypothetical protein
MEEFALAEWSQKDGRNGGGAAPQFQVSINTIHDKKGPNMAL